MDQVMVLNYSAASGRAKSEEVAMMVIFRQCEKFV